MKVFLNIIFCFFLFFGFYQNSIAQNIEIDSLLKILEKANSAVEKVDIYNELTLEHFAFIRSKVYLKKQGHYYQKALELAEKVGYQKGLNIAKVNHLVWKAHTLWHNKEFDKINSIVQRIILISEKIGYSKGIDISYTILGWAFLYKHNYQASLVNFLKALEKHQKSNWKVALGWTYQGLGELSDLISNNLNNALAYFILSENIAIATKNQSLLLACYEGNYWFHSVRGNYPLVYQSCLKTLNIVEKLKDKEVIGRIFHRIGNIYRDNENYNVALDFYQKSSEIYDGNLSNDGLIFDIGEIYALQSDTTRAMEYFQNAFKISSKGKNIWLNLYIKAHLVLYGHQLQYRLIIPKLKVLIEEFQKIGIEYKHTVAKLTFKLSSVYLQNQQFNEAKIWLEKGFKIARDINAQQLNMEGYKIQYDLCKATGNFQKALESFEFYQQQREKILGRQKATEIAGLEMDVKFQKQEKENNFLKQNNELIESKLREKNLLIYSSLAGICLLLAVAYILWRNNRLKQKANRQLTASNELIDLLFSELNHRVLNNLQVVSLLLRSEKRKAEQNLDKVNFDKIESRINELANVHRLLMYGKNRQSIVDVTEYLSNITKTLSGLYQTDNQIVKINIDAQDLHLPLNQAYFLGFIVYELFTNSLKYAYQEVKEPEFSIQIQQINQAIELQIADNGKGMPAELWENGQLKTEMMQTLGLKIVSSITRIYQGYFTVSQPEKQIGSLFIAKLVF